MCVLGLPNFDHLKSRPLAIITFIMPDIWQPFDVPAADLGNPWGYFFHIAHTHP